MTKPEPRPAHDELNDPLVAPTLTNDCYREPGETFAQAWKSHIESTLNPDISGDAALHPTTVY